MGVTAIVVYFLPLLLRPEYSFVPSRKTCKISRSYLVLICARVFILHAGDRIWCRCTMHVRNIYKRHAN